MKPFLLLLAGMAVFPLTVMAADTVGPVVGTVSPLQAVYTVPQTFRVSAEDASGVASCTLVVSSTYQVPMTLVATNSWEAIYTFTTLRSANSIRAVCTDTAGNKTTGKGRVVSVSESPTTPSSGQPQPVDPQSTPTTDMTHADRETIIAGSPVLIKTACPGGEGVSHPCRTVYFLDAYGKRHAFPNEKTYFTWYANWNGIYIVSDAHMISFPLGKNVRYRPGVRMVKFSSLSKVYVVGRYGDLRPVESEAVAKALYGEAWNTQIDDVSEVFYGNYRVRIDRPVVFVSDYAPQAERESVPSINDNLDD